MNFISVIIPSFNRRELTHRAVASLLAQTHREMEIIVVDDCSRPEEVFVPLPAEETAVRVIRHEVNQGVSAARNTGVREARGEYIAFLDSDDIALPDRLEKHLAFLLQQPDAENCLIYSYYHFQEPGGRMQVPRRPISPGQTMSDYLFMERGFLHIDTWLAKKQLIERFPQNSELRLSEDIDVLLRMEAAGVRFAFCPIIAAVHYCDDREDRLTGNLLSNERYQKSQELLLKLHGDRMPARVVVLFETTLVKRRSDGESKFSHFSDKLRSLAATDRLGFGAKCGLIWDYLVSRLQQRLWVIRSRKRNG